MIYFVRHSETDYNVKKIIAGQINIPINENGYKQAEIIRNELKDIKFDYVFCSPLDRTIQTAKVITDNELILDDRIIERGSGDLEGTCFLDWKENINYNDPKETRYNIENYFVFKERVYSFCNYLLNNFQNKNILVVTHRGVIMYARGFFEGEPLDRNYNIYSVGNCNITKYDNNESIIKQKKLSLRK